MDDAFLSQYRQILLQTLKTFDEFCTAKNINYFAASGTAIGAVRHQGMIPWDDDIDVYMLRKDYDYFLSIRDELLPLGYKVSALGDKDYIYPFAKVFAKNTTLIENQYSLDCRIGPFVDIFPLDEVQGDIEVIKRKKNAYLELHNKFFHTYCKPTLDNLRNLIRKRYFKTILTVISPSCFKNYLRNNFIDYDKTWATEKGEMLFFHGATYPVEREIFPKKWFESYHYVPFENLYIRVSDNVHDYLTLMFGDYMTPPPPEKRISEHKIYYLNLKEELSTKEVQKRIKKGEFLVY